MSKNKEVVYGSGALNYDETMKQVVGYLRSLVGNPNMNVQFIGAHTDIVSKIKILPRAAPREQSINIGKRMLHIVHELETEQTLKISITPKGNGETLVTLTRKVRRRS